MAEELTSISLAQPNGDEIYTKQEQLETLKAKCKSLKEELRQKRPRAQYVGREDIPRKLAVSRKVDFRSPKYGPRLCRTRGTFEKRLLARRPKGPAATPSSEAMNLSESDGSQSETENEILDDKNDAEYEEKDQVLSSDSLCSDCTVLCGGLKISNDLTCRLFEHQREGVKWMWELHQQEAGGILGDEMGLGKTAQVIAFLGSLHFNKLYRPSLVLCPVTLLHHWSKEISEWYPWLRVHILHESSLKRTASKSFKKTVHDAVQSTAGILITTYDHFRIYSEELLFFKWGYVVLDEGHKIKNPDADITLLVKQVRTRHRLIITGSPVQNKLTELWSLFDFIFPGKLGTLPVFEAEFSIPIQVGGYRNASRLSVATAIKCAAILHNTILPYMLIRQKSEVDLNLPTKNEHVLFCKLSKEQRKLYKDYISSDEVESIFRGKQEVLAGIDILRKICNHPDILQLDSNRVVEYGKQDRSGKLQVCIEILKEWKQQGDKVLIFTQTQLMLNILEYHFQKAEYSYHRMDGQTPITARNKYIQSFNTDKSVFAFLLTTRVGGLGVNLTGANKVLIYDPDWNPSIDIQAKERAWRIGQSREVTIYRLISIGTIEEKIYQRQIFKQSLKNKVLTKTSQKRLFTSKNIRDLFTLDDERQGQQTETERLLQKAASKDEPKDHVLESILKSGVKTILDQKTVEMASEIETNKDPLSYKATQMAQEALSKMQTAEEERSKYKVHFPTWTGKNGAAGAPRSLKSDDKILFKLSNSAIEAGTRVLTAPSSTSLLSKMEKRKQISERQDLVEILNFKEETYSLPARSLSELKAPEPKLKKRSSEVAQKNLLDEISDDDMLQWKPLIIEFFKKRGNVADASVLNSSLVVGIQPDKREKFKQVVLGLARKSPGTSRWVLNSNL